MKPLISVLLAIALGCSSKKDPTPQPTTGSLEVAVSGLPAGASADVTVTGPGSFTQHLTGSQTLTSLQPGSYTVSAPAVTAGGAGYTSAISGSPASVVAGGTAAASVTYTVVSPT